MESSSIAVFIPHIGVDEVPGPRWELELAPALSVPS
jgi:hypothetical protein